uniref:N-acetyltransferase domain-containing protein n=2 Tax=Ditylum brightwellii TaxID=49249 RepID=A0A7S4UPM8_9STRA|mmetsp:Transcript_6951/g.9309  ORF Transcript_6951/g.9309 Transcript_6951/m.9309 type:complete len:255 (+) Transcript_6951:24-788(+)
MRLNYETCISGSKCALVPYRPEHVPTYHTWMKDSFLLEMTGSEPLSYEEEVAMQKSWMEDEEKCTFIVLSKDEVDFNDEDVEESGTLPSISDERCVPPEFIRKHLNAMIGDVNLFLSDEEEDSEDGEATDESVAQVQKQAELDIMIASRDHRRKGMGKEAVIIMMIYGAEKLGIRRFFVKIKDENTASRRMFEETLGFIECNYAACFKEVELEYRFDTSEEMAKKLRERLGGSMVSWKCSISPFSSVEHSSEEQ